MVHFCKALSTYLHIFVDPENNGTERSVKLWQDETIMLLIDFVKKYNDELEKGIKKYVWKKIAHEMFEKTGKQYSVMQIETKWKGLVRHYKEILRHNSISGNSRKEWKFYSAVNELLYKKPEINPVAVCDSYKGLIIKSKKSVNEDEHDINAIKTVYESSFSQQRKRKECGVSKRHTEKMQRLDKLQSTLDRMVDLMATKLAGNNNK